MFMLVWEWKDEDTGELYEQRIDWFDTKEELLAAYKKAREEYSKMVNIGRLYLVAAINYSWADIEDIFQPTRPAQFSLSPCGAFLKVNQD